MRYPTYKLFLAFLLLSAFYVAWQTGFTFTFSECRGFPNYNMLSRALMHGQVSIDAHGVEDVIVFNRKAFMYSGPFPALIRVPILMVFGIDIPTGLMTAVFCAGVGILFFMVLGQLEGPNGSRLRAPWQVAFIAVFLFNGFSLFMVTVPTFHHEAICSAMFFLMASIYLLLRAWNADYRMSLPQTILMGLCLSFCVASRFSYAMAAGVIFISLAWGMLNNRETIPTSKIIRTLLIMAFIGSVALGLLLTYNYLRCGSFMDFGIKHVTSVVFGPYFAKGHFARYDHLPYNLWAIFFGLPLLSHAFPYLILPAYVLNVKSLGPMPYWLVHTNELSVSVFILLPLTLFALSPALAAKLDFEKTYIRKYLILLLIMALQVFSTAITLATTARYYYDFLPILMLMAYLGAAMSIEHMRRPNVLIVSLALLSMVVSMALPMNAIVFYKHYINYVSPLLGLFGI
jgi:hypothetical protein